MIEDGWLALAAAIFGGAGLKAVEAVINRSKNRASMAAELRDELRTDVQALRDELKHVESELDKWRLKYYNLLSLLNFAKFVLYQNGLENEVQEIDEKITGSLQIEEVLKHLDN